MTPNELQAAYQQATTYRERDSLATAWYRAGYYDTLGHDIEGRTYRTVEDDREIVVGTTERVEGVGLIMSFRSY